MDIPLKGSIRNNSLVKLLVYLNRNRMTGTLSLETPVFTKKAYISKGDAVFASSTFEDDRLGEMLIKAGKISVEQYDRSVELLKSSKKRQGAILVELGYLTPKDLFWGVKYQVKEIIHSMFLIEDGQYEFAEGGIPTEEVITLKMSMANLIYEGVRKIDNWTRIRNEMPETDSVLKLSSDPLTLFQQIELSSQDKKILSLVDGKKTIKNVIDGSWMGSFEALKILYVLWSLGMVEQSAALDPRQPAAMDLGDASEPTISLDDILQPHTEEEEALLKKVESLYPRLGSLSSADLLEVDASADSETIKKNYYKLAKEFHPDRYFSLPDPSIKEKLTAIFDALTSAYNTLKDDHLRQEFSGTSATAGERNKADDTHLAEEQFQRGIAEFKHGNFWGAVDNFNGAAKLMPKSANLWSYLSLAYSKIPGKLREAEEALMTAIKLEPFNADYYANLGLIYLKGGLKNRAVSNFQKALQISPANVKAQRGLEQARK